MKIIVRGACDDDALVDAGERGAEGSGLKAVEDDGFDAVGIDQVAGEKCGVAATDGAGLVPGILAHDGAVGMGEAQREADGQGAGALSLEAAAPGIRHVGKERIQSRRDRRMHVAIHDARFLACRLLPFQRWSVHRHRVSPRHFHRLVLARESRAR